MVKDDKAKNGWSTQMLSTEGYPVPFTLIIAREYLLGYLLIFFFYNIWEIDWADLIHDS